MLKTDRNTVSVPPGTYVPPGLDQVVQSQIYVDDSTEFDLDDSDIAVEQGIEVDETFTDISDAPPIPENFTIVSQNVKVMPDGTQLVDVIIDTDNFPGVQDMEVRVTKT